MTRPVRSHVVRWLAALAAGLLAVLGAWPTPGLVWNSEPDNSSGPEQLRTKAPQLKSGARAPIAGLTSIGLGAVAVVTTLYGMQHDPLGTALYNRAQINVGNAGPLILTGTVVAIGLVCAAVGLRTRRRWPAIAGICLNASALVLALFVKLAVEHGFGA
jgi:hypothetical protein